MKKKKLIYLLTVFLLIIPFLSYADGNRFVVVIDAGHGGKDPGAIGKIINEKKVNLGIALKLGEMISKNNPDVKIVYTRKTDVFVELQERASIANRAKADLFISIHTNSAKSKSAFGTETYTLGLARSEENLEVAKRENSVILLEDDFSTRYEGFDPKSTESYIMFEFIQDKHMEQSIDLASTIQKQFRSAAGRNDRGVRQAGFLVLRNTGMPSVLVEVGYISNASEERFLASKEGQTKIARSIYNAFCDYKAGYDRKQGRIYNKTDNAKNNKETAGKNIVPVSGTKKTQNNTDEQTKTRQIGYKIQFMTSTAYYGKKSSRYKGLSPVSCYKENGLYKYTCYEASDRNDLQKKLTEVRKLFKDAFIVGFKDGEKLK